MTTCSSCGMLFTRSVPHPAPDDVCTACWDDQQHELAAQDRDDELADRRCDAEMGR